MDELLAVKGSVGPREQTPRCVFRYNLRKDLFGPAVATFAVVIDNRTVGTFTTDDRGSFDMELQEGEVPS